MWRRSTAFSCRSTNNSAPSAMRLHNTAAGTLIRFQTSVETTDSNIRRSSQSSRSRVARINKPADPATNHIFKRQLRDGRATKPAADRKSVAYAYGTHGEGEGRDRDAAPNPGEQAAVDRILGLRDEGKSYRAIGEQLRRRGHHPARAAQWNAMTVRSICQRHGVA